MYEEIHKSARAALLELLDVAALKPGQQVVVGCSSSEIMGQKIGKGSTPEAAKAVVDEIMPILVLPMSRPASAFTNSTATGSSIAS